MLGVWRTSESARAPIDKGRIRGVAEGKRLALGNKALMQREGVDVAE